jgi:hypothetical protein
MKASLNSKKKIWLQHNNIMLGNTNRQIFSRNVKHPFPVMMGAIPLSRTLICSYPLHILWTGITLLFIKLEWSYQNVCLVGLYLLALWV